MPRRRLGGEQSSLVPPNSFPVPDDVVDRWLPCLSGAELKVLLYILRRTLGFYKRQDAISYKQFTDGIERHDGIRLDGGAGVSRGALRPALRKLEDLGLIVAERRPLPNNDYEATLYSVRWVDSGAVRPGTISVQGGTGTVMDPGQKLGEDPGQKLTPQDTVQDTVIQEIPDPTFDQIVRKAAVGLNRWPKRADVAGEISKLTNAYAAGMDELALAVDRALHTTDARRSPDAFYAELARLLEIATRP